MEQRRHSSRYFEPKEVAVKLGGKTLKRGFVAVLGQAAVFIVQTLSIIILARLLEPDDFGLVGMVTIVIVFIRFFRDLGLSKATIQHPEISRGEISNLFWLNSIIGGGLALLLLVTAPMVASFYGRAELVAISMALAAGVFVEGVALQHRALLTRAMQFKELAIVDAIAQLLAAFVAIFVAANGGGYWALVVMPLAAAFFRGIAVCLLTGWLPNMPDLNVNIRSYLRYGGNLFGASILSFFMFNADKILIGRFVGANELGLYSNAYRLTLVPLQQLNGPMLNVMLPTLSGFNGDAECYRAAFYRMVKVLLGLTWPGIGLMYVVAPSLFVILLGPEWESSAYVFRILAPVALIMAANCATEWVCLIEGSTERLFRWSLFNVPFTCVCLCVGVHFWGMPGVAFAFSFAFCVTRVSCMKYLYRGSSIEFTTIVCIMARILLPVFGAALFALSLSNGAGLVVLAQGAVAYICAFVVLDFVFNRSRSICLIALGAMKKQFIK